MLSLVSFSLNLEAADTINQGLDLFQKKQFEKALPYLEASHSKNDPRVQAALGYMYRDGLGVEKDYQKAFMLFLESAKQSNPKGQFGVGSMYDRGFFVKRNKEKAFKWYLYAAENGYSSAQNNVAWSYVHGEGIPKDYKKAREWYEKAMIQGHSNAMVGLSFMYYWGKGVKKIVIKQRNWTNGRQRWETEKDSSIWAGITKMEQVFPKTTSKPFTGTLKPLKTVIPWLWNVFMKPITSTDWV